jgi:hypothetical protein
MSSGGQRNGNRTIKEWQQKSKEMASKGQRKNTSFQKKSFINSNLKGEIIVSKSMTEIYNFASEKQRWLKKT